MKNKISEAEYFGIEFAGYKDDDAIEKLLQEQQGHIKNAFYRNELGGICLVWGDGNGGLSHTITRRDNDLKNGKSSIGGIEMVRKIPTIINNGEFSIDDKDRAKIEYGIYRVGIGVKFYDHKMNWVVTAMEITDK